MQKKLLTIGLVAMMLFGSTITAFASKGTTNTPGGTNPTTLTIPVTASIDNYYVVSIPAAGGNAINLTKEHNDQLNTRDASGADIDSASTFYGLCDVQAKGILADGYELTATVKCTDMVNASDATKKSTVGLANVGFYDTTVDAKKTKDILAGTDTTSSVQFVDTGFTNGTAGVSCVFGSDKLSDDSQTFEQDVLLRTTLPYTGNYTGSLTISFGIDVAH